MSSNNKQNESLGVNKIGKNIKKSPFNQPNVANNNSGSNNNNQTKQRPQPHIYNIDKHDFRTFVQQATGSPSHNNSHDPPQQNPSTRLRKIRPPPLTPITHPRVPLVGPLVHPPPRPPVPALSPISAFMQQLETCIGDQGSRTPAPIVHEQGQGQGQGQQLLPSPSGFYNLLSPIPLSPYSFLSPGVRYQPPLSPIFSFSPIGKPEMWGPAAQQTPFSPGFVFSRSPSGFFPGSSPRWRHQ